MIKKVLFTALLASAFSISGMSQDNSYAIDAETGATQQEGKKEFDAKKYEKTSKTLERLADAASRFHIGGYGEIAFSRNYYSDSGYRYTDYNKYKNSPSHGRFDIPHAVINIGYDFGKGWTFGTEIEFEHGGTGSTYESEADEGTEWEHEQEKGGEVELEQFWIQKSFAKWANIRAGHIIVPVGLNNLQHEPLNFFTVYRPEGENTILPSTWHQTGIDFWGRYKFVRYEVQFLPGLSAENFTKDKWINKGRKALLEGEFANKYAASLRLDFYPVEGLRVGLSGYIGQAIGNNAITQLTGVETKYKGTLAIGCIDATFERWGIKFRGWSDWGHLSDAEEIMLLSGRVDSQSPYHNTGYVSSRAFARGFQLGYNVFELIPCMKKKHQKLYPFVTYEHYNSYAEPIGNNKYPYEDRHRFAVGINYMPLKQIVVKGEYSHRHFHEPYNQEPSINFCVAYQGWFL